MKKRLAACLSGLFLVAPLSVNASDFSYTYIEGFYAHTEVDDGPIDVDGDGYRVGGSLGLGENFFLFARWQDYDLDNSVDTQLLKLGGGLHVPLGFLPADLVLDAGYVEAEIDTPFGDVDDEGYTAGASLRFAILPFLELEGGASYIDLDDFGDEVLFDAMARLFVTPFLALQVGAEIDDDGDNETYLAGVRFEF